jgi:hypothetical protein
MVVRRAETARRALKIKCQMAPLRAFNDHGRQWLSTCMCARIRDATISLYPMSTLHPPLIAHPAHMLHALASALTPPSSRRASPPAPPRPQPISSSRCPLSPMEKRYTTQVMSNEVALGLSPLKVNLTAYPSESRMAVYISLYVLYQVSSRKSPRLADV